MRRRDFIKWGTLIGISSYLYPEGIVAQRNSQFAQVRDTIDAVQQHMFPENSLLPSTKAMDVVLFIEETLYHPTYDKDIRAFVIDGARELIKRERGNFIHLDSAGKERALRAYEQTGYGSSWLARIMTLTLEALLSDPIYGSNKNESGWKALKSFGGVPRPSVRYIEI